MRTGRIKINDKEYTICMSTRVLMGLEEKGLSLEGVFADGAHQITNIFTLLHLMMDAGYRWAKMNDEEAEEPPTLDELMDSTAVDQYEGIVAGITATLADTGRKVEATPPKGKAVSQQSHNRHG